MALKNRPKSSPPAAHGAERHPASFRDDRGYIFFSGEELRRGVLEPGRAAYEQLMSSGLYEALTSKALLIKHEEVQATVPFAKVLAPELVLFISYPYEWSFSQLRDAALLTLKIQRLALKHGQTLRDASAYNIQFVGGRPIMIDTLSFEPYTPGQPWIAYRQFCQHFLAPLALMSYRDPSLSQLLRVHLDGLPLSLAAGLLPLGARLKPGLGLHIVAHGRLQARSSTSDTVAAPRAQRSISQAGMLGLLDSLERATSGLKLSTTKTEWSNYYDETNYSAAALAEKEAIVERFVARVKPVRTLDLGANNGRFSRLAVAHSQLVISTDIDPLAVEANYLKVKRDHDTKLLPLLIDLTNPSPALGWADAERAAFTERAAADLVLALALVHHLAISGNLPLELIAAYFARLGPQLVIEFVPKSDSKVQFLLASREDIFADYTPGGFEAAFARHFTIAAKHPIKDSGRSIYLMKVRDAK